MRPKNDKKNTKRASRLPIASKKHGKEGAGKSKAKTGSQRARSDGLRAPHDSYFLWGHHALAAALSNHKRPIKALYCTKDSHERLNQLLSHLPEARLRALPEVKLVDKSLLDTIEGDHEASGKPVHQGMVAAVSPLEAPHLEDYLASLDEERPVRLMVLDQVSDPRNIGAIFRSARAFGTSAIIVQDRHAPEETGSLARTAVGALEEITYIRVVNLARALDKLKDHHFHIAGLDMAGTDQTQTAASADRLALVMGSEGKGMRRLTKDACDEILSIKMADSSESLNVSVAAAIMMHSTQKSDK